MTNAEDLDQSATNEIPGSFTRGMLIFEDGSDATKTFEVRLTEGNFQLTPGDFEDIEGRVRGRVDFVLKGNQGTTTASLTAYCDKATDPNKPRLFIFLRGKLPSGWVKVDKRIEKPNVNVRFITFNQDGVTIDFEVLLKRCTVSGSFQEGPINTLQVNVKSYEPFPEVPGENITQSEAA